MKYFILVGEASGDLHASNLLQALREQDPQAVFVGLGGDKMQAQGCHLYQHYRQMAFMGVADVLRNLGKVKHNLSLAQEALLHERPDVLILVDYPGFNLRIAKFCRRVLPDTKIVYYIPPKIWAWKRWRVHTIAKLCDRVLGIFPFEPAFYRRFGYECTYVGNPTVDAIRAWQQLSTLNSQISTLNSIALLPGSRRGEISHCLPLMVTAAQRVISDLPDSEHWSIRIAAAPGVEDDFYTALLTPLMDGKVDAGLLSRDTYALISEARAAVVNSGTATLETALLGCPQTAVYHIALAKLVNPLRHIVFSIPQFTLVNILAQRPLIRELLAADLTEQNIYNELSRLLTDASYRQAQLDGYAQIHDLLGTRPAAVTAAQIITSLC